jgi:hypothetical protein
MRRAPIAKTFGSAPASLACSPVPVVTVSNGPSAFYRQHHVVEAPAIDEREFRPAWRVKTKLMLLIETGRIDRRQLEAAAAFLRAGARQSAGNAPRPGSRCGSIAAAAPKGSSRHTRSMPPADCTTPARS